VAITSARDKMPFEVTPFFPRLTRTGSSDKTSSNGIPANGTTASSTTASATPAN
jgi:hypothetical protein